MQNQQNKTIRILRRLIKSKLQKKTHPLIRLQLLLVIIIIVGIVVF